MSTIDFALGVMNDISSTKPVMFQRGNSLYIASEEGFAQIGGLQIVPTNYSERTSEEPKSESTNVIHRWAKSNRGRVPTFKKGERPYIQSISFGRDDMILSLEDMAKTSRTLNKLSDDGKIRMVSHSSSYQSHKHGYASDGINVWLKSARVMDRKRYLELCTQQEEALLAKGENLPSFSLYEDNNLYRQFLVPLNIILTPNIQIEFPCEGASGVTEYDIPWNMYSDVSSSSAHITNRAPSQESPFGVKVRLNPYVFQLENDSFMNRINEEVDAVRANQPRIAEYFERLNNIHNHVYANNIARRKELRKNKTT